MIPLPSPSIHMTISGPVSFLYFTLEWSSIWAITIMSRTLENKHQHLTHQSIHTHRYRIILCVKFQLSCPVPIHFQHFCFMLVPSYCGQTFNSLLMKYPLFDCKVKISFTKQKCNIEPALLFTLIILTQN